MLIGGLVTGGSVGLLSALLRQRNAILEDKREADDTALELHLPPRLRKQANLLSMAANTLSSVGEGINTSVGAVVNAAKERMGSKPVAEPRPEQALSLYDYLLGGAAFPLAALGGLQLTRKAYQGWREQDVRERLKEQQQRYMEALMTEADEKEVKRASDRRPLSTSQWVALAVGGIPLLTALTSGLLTDRFLDQQFPLKPKPKFPVNGVRLGIDDEPPTEDSDQFKKAADVLVHTALQFEKQASDAGVCQVVAAVAAGMLDDLEAHQFKYGSDAMLDLAAGANLVLPRDPLVKCAAIHAGVRSSIGPALLVMSAGAFAEAAPSWRQEGGMLAEHEKLASQLIDCAAATLDLHIAALAGEDNIKAAAQLAQAPAMEQLRKSLLQGADKDDPTQANTGTLQAAATGSQFSNPAEQAGRPVNSQADIVDSVLN
jgi:hypothetical protein